MHLPIKRDPLLMLINVLFSFIHPNRSHTHNPGSYSAIVWSKAAVLLINPDLHQRHLLKCISDAKSLILFPLESFLHPVKFTTTVFCFAA